MTSIDVQFRFLQVVVNHLADERVTVGLLHWNGTQLRTAFNAAKVPDDVVSKPDLRNVLRSLDLALREQSKSINQAQTLDDFVPVPLGETGLLSWGALKAAQTRDPEQHFTQLVRMLGLQHEVVKRRQGFEPKFVSFAASLAASINRPDAIRVRNVLQGLVQYESPLSWKNGVWRHTFPIEITPIDTTKLATRIEKLFGRIDATVPKNEVGVVVALFETEPSLDESLGGVEDYIRNNLAGRVESIRAPVVAGEPDFKDIDDKVRAEISAERP